MSLPALPSRRNRFAICLLFFAVTFTVYGSSLRNQFVEWDDTFLIKENTIVASMNASTIKQAFSSYDPELYIPLTFLSYQVDHAIGGLDPFFYHLTNLLFHTLNAILVAWFLSLFLENGWLALALGFLFAVHPLNTEAVAWASARKDVLSTFFFFATLISYFYASEKKDRRLFLFSVTCFLLGLLSKVMIVMLPVVLVLLDTVRNERIDGKSLRNKTPYFALAFIFGIVGLFGKSKILVASTLWQKILMACVSTIFYVQKFLWPTGLSVLYPYTKTITLFSPDFFVPALLTIVLIVSAVRLWKRQRLASAGILFFLITLVPTFTNFAKGGDVYFASDRYAYIPMVGLLLMSGAVLRTFLHASSSVRVQRERVRCVTAFAAVILVSSSVVAFRQATTWQDSFSLFSNTLLFYPNSNIAHNNIGMEYLSQGRTDEALASLETAIAIKPDPKSLTNLAAAKSQKGLFDDALEIFRKVISENPDAADAMYGIGNVYQKQGRFAEAANQYRKVIAIDREYFNAYNNLGAVYLQLHDWNNAVSVLRTSIELKPSFVESFYNLGIALKQLGRVDEAEEQFQTAIRMNPEDADALANLAVLLYDRRQIDEAAGALKKALVIDQSNPTGIELLMRMKKDGVVR